MKIVARSMLFLLALGAPMGCYVQAGSAVPVTEGDVVVADPPPPVFEPLPPPPSASVVWVAGYHRWNGSHYVWVHGRYERPPHTRARYVPAHWEAHRRGRIWINGHWS